MTIVGWMRNFQTCFCICMQIQIFVFPMSGTRLCKWHMWRWANMLLAWKSCKLRFNLAANSYHFSNVLTWHLRFWPLKIFLMPGNHNSRFWFSNLGFPTKTPTRNARKTTAKSIKTGTKTHKRPQNGKSRATQVFKNLSFQDDLGVFQRVCLLCS